MTTRRQFLQTAAATALMPYTFTANAEDQTRPRSANDRARIGAIGMKYQGSVVAEKALEYGDVVAICDVDRDIAEKARMQFGGKAELYEDYQKMLERPDLDVITIGTPDHWHTAMVIAACRAGKDVYCEKPLTLTIDEGKLLTKVVKDTGRVVQVGSWQRSDQRFRTAVEMVRQGRAGKLKSVQVILGKNKTGGPFTPQAVPAHLNWNLWQGQTPDTPYIPERCHYTFRWWYEYSGGQMTDWGAHHIDIAAWGLGLDDTTGPIEIEGRAKFPEVSNGYNVAIDYAVTYRLQNGLELEVLDTGRNGVTFNGERGRVFVNRENLEGVPAQELKTQPLPREQFRLYAHDNLARPERKGKLESIINHMGNFFDCVKSRNPPISDVLSQHRSVTLCHLANISMRLGRKVTWDPATEQILNDSEANAWQKREQRKGFEIG